MASEADTAGLLEIHVKVIGQEEDVLSFFIDSSASVLDLKNKIKDELDPSEAVPVERQRLIFSGRMLRTDEESLSDARMKTNSVNCIHLTPLPQGARPSARDGTDGNRLPSNDQPRATASASEGAQRRRARNVQRLRVRELSRDHPYALAIPARIVMTTSRTAADTRQNESSAAGEAGSNNDVEQSSRSVNAALAEQQRSALLGVGRPSFALSASARILALFEERVNRDALMEAYHAQATAAARESTERLRQASLAHLLELTARTAESPGLSRGAPRETPHLVSAMRRASPTRRPTRPSVATTASARTPRIGVATTSSSTSQAPGGSESSSERPQRVRRSRRSDP